MRAITHPSFPSFRLAWITIACLLSFGNLTAQPTRYEYRELHLGVAVRIVLYAEDADLARAAARAAYDRIAAIEDVLSDYRPGSELRQLGAHPAGLPLALSDDLYAVLRLSVDVAQRTDGAFDPTVGPLTAIWREARRTGVPPDSAAAAEAATRGGWRKLSIDESARTATLAMDNMRLDVGGIGKGYAMDEAGVELAKMGITSALIEAGGDVLVSGPPPNSSGWSVVTYVDNDPLRRRLGSVAHAAVATSGSSAQFVEADGRRYSHVVDPRSGHPVTHLMEAVVIAPSATLADGLATALLVLGPDGKEFLAARFPEVVFFLGGVRGGGSEPEAQSPAQEKRLPL